MGKTDLIINTNPKSIFSESIKTIRTNLNFSNINKDMKVVLVTSPEAGDGKSFITSNLACAYAQEGKRVLLIDCDLRKGRQHEIFEVMNIASAGYSNLIFNYNDYEEKSQNNGDNNNNNNSNNNNKKKGFPKVKTNELFNKYVIKTDIDNVDLIPTGPTPPNPVELLGSDSNRKLIELFKRYYDIIILDCPPIVGLSDSILLTQLSDVNFLVVSTKKTRQEALERAIKAFEQANAKLSGVVLNKYQLKNNGYYSYYYSSKYYEGK